MYTHDNISVVVSDAHTDLVEDHLIALCSFANVSLDGAARQAQRQAQRRRSSVLCHTTAPLGSNRACTSIVYRMRFCLLAPLEFLD